MDKKLLSDAIVEAKDGAKKIEILNYQLSNKYGRKNSPRIYFDVVPVFIRNEWVFVSDCEEIVDKYSLVTYDYNIIEDDYTITFVIPKEEE